MFSANSLPETTFATPASTPNVNHLYCIVHCCVNSCDSSKNMARSFRAGLVVKPIDFNSRTGGRDVFVFSTADQAGQQVGSSGQAVPP